MPRSSSQRMRAVQAPVIPIIAGWVAETPGTISLGQGVVSFGPPPEAIEAARRYGDRPGDHLYGPVEGDPELVACIAGKLAAENGIPVGAEARVVVTAGGNMAFLNAVLAVADPGDEFVLPVPYYFNHEMAIMMAGCRPVPVPTREGHQLDLEAIARSLSPRTRAVVTVSPNNPSGAVYPEEDLRALNALCAAHGCWHIHDEVYEYFTYDGARHFSPGSVTGASAHTITLFSLSKAYGLAAWRIGYMVVPATLLEAVTKIQDTNLICPPRVSQRAAVAALGVGRAWVRPRVEALGGVRRIVLDVLGSRPDVCQVAPAAGAFYCLVSVRSALDDLSLVRRLVQEHQVAVVPGSAFGLGGCWLRVSYGALDRESVVEGVGRLLRGLVALGGA